MFGVQWTAYMIFMVLVGGLGTFEGPIIGAVIFYLIQANFGDSGAWYFVGLGRRRDRLRALPAPRALGRDRPAAPVAVAAGRLHTTTLKAGTRPTRAELDDSA